MSHQLTELSEEEHSLNDTDSKDYSEKNARIKKKKSSTTFNVDDDIKLRKK